MHRAKPAMACAGGALDRAQGVNRRALPAMPRTPAAGMRGGSRHRGTEDTEK